MNNKFESLIFSDGTWWVEYKGDLPNTEFLPVDRLQYFAVKKSLEYINRHKKEWIRSDFNIWYRKIDDHLERDGVAEVWEKLSKDETRRIRLEIHE